MQYRSGIAVLLGDLVDYSGQNGCVVAFGEDVNCFCAIDDFRWTKESGPGLWVYFSNGAIANLKEPDEDLLLISRAIGDVDPNVS